MKLFVILKPKTLKGDIGLVTFLTLIFLLWPAIEVRGSAHPKSQRLRGKGDTHSRKWLVFLCFCPSIPDNFDNKEGHFMLCQIPAKSIGGGY